MIIVQVKEGENIERALKKFKRKFERTGVVKELRARQAFQKPSVTNRKKMMKAIDRSTAPAIILQFFARIRRLCRKKSVNLHRFLASRVMGN